MTEFHIYGTANGWRDGDLSWAFTVDGKKFSGLLEAKQGNTPLLASYTALMNALTYANKFGLKDLKIVTEDMTLVSQMNGIWNVKKGTAHYEPAQMILAWTRQAGINIIYSYEKKEYWEDSPAKDLAQHTLDEFLRKNKK